METLSNGTNTFSINSVIRQNSDLNEFRVLWVEKDGICFWINLTKSANTPQEVQYSYIVSGLANGTLEISADSWYAIQDTGNISDKAKLRQQKNWELIQDAVKDEPAIYNVVNRAAILKEIEAKSGVKVPNIYKFLGRYWRGGMTADALYPDFSNCGKGSGILNPDANSPGRKKRPGAIGKKLVTEDVNIFQKGIQEFYLTSAKPSLREAYENMTKKYYSALDENGIRIDLKPDDVPSFYQFKYYYYSHMDPTESKKKRDGQRSYDLNHRPILHKTASYVFGPGDAVQVDATIGDIYLVRRDKRSDIAGRPTVYFVVDAAESMVAGLHVTFDPPCWKDALMAILNCAEDKVQFCKRYGITITPEEWPCQFIPNRLVADRGEVESSAADVLVNRLGITIDNTVPFRGDFKGNVEQHFHVTNCELPSDLPGKVTKDFGQRGTHDPRLDSNLDIVQYTAILIHQTLFYNNHHWMNTFVRTPEMRIHSVPSVPRDLWNHGMKYATGVPRIVPMKMIRQMVFPKGTATISRKGIEFNKLMYTCEQAEAQQWFSNAEITGAKEITVSYNPLDLAFVYIQVGEEVYECHLLEYNGMYCGVSSHEHNADLEDDRNLKAAHSIDELNANHKMKDAIEQILLEAKQSAPLHTNESKKSRLEKIKENRNEERQAHIDFNTEKSLEAADLLPQPNSQATDSNCKQLINETNSEEENSTSARTSGAFAETGIDPVMQEIIDLLNEQLGKERENHDSGNI